jgi:peptidoglycan/xylan/chitin deacetylase (PgdA/CDA1 family)
VDDGDDLTTSTRQLLDQTRVLQRGPFSIHFTVGPDVITFGDGNGINLPNRPGAQDLVRRLGNLGNYAYSWHKLPVQHELGSHGGWIHDYWALSANEENAPDLTPLLAQNFDAIEKVTGRKIREYSAPGGNNPTWAVKWLEKRGVVAFYTVGDGGAAAVRSWRNGARLTDKMWSIPVTPQGRYATFEEFDDFGISDATSGQWLLDLQSFVVNRRSNRMFYNHPPGAADHLKPINALLGRADRLQANNRFRWYTMVQVADFSQRRLATTWNTSTQFGFTVFSASHPTSLADVTWLLPRSRYTLPLVTWGQGNVGSDNKNWIVTAEQGTSLRFVTIER